MQDIQTAKLFMNGNSQALRLPKEFRFEGSEVMIYKEGSRTILQPKQSQWRDFFLADYGDAAEDFLVNREDTPPQDRELFDDV